jgi:anti-sigma B factor antagonist
MAQFRLQTTRADGVCVVAAEGELDLASARALEREILSACVDGGDVLVDLRATKFMDSSGLRALLRGRETCVARGAELAVVRELPTQVRRVLEVAGIDDRQLPFADPPGCGRAQPDDDPALA